MSILSQLKLIHLRCYMSPENLDIIILVSIRFGFASGHSLHSSYYKSCDVIGTQNNCKMS